MKRISTLLFLLCMVFYGYAQTLTIRDRETHEPLELVTLLSEQPKASATTNQEGKVDISHFKEAVLIEVRLLGYKTRLLSYEALLASDLELALEQSKFLLDPVVVSATKWNQSLTDVPQKITSISRREVALQNPQTAADLLGTSGEVFIQKSQQGGGSPMIRGFSTNRLLYVVDGIRMNTAIFRSGNLQNVISLDPFAIENTEVLFGPGSVIYGSDAIGGVMNFQTLKPQFSQEDKFTVDGRVISKYASANNERTGHIDFQVGGKKWAFLTSVSTHNFDDLRMGKHGPDEYLRHFFVEREGDSDRIVANSDPRLQTPSAYDQINLMQKVSFRANENWEFNYGFHHSATSSYARYDRRLRTSNGLPRYGQWDYGPQKWMMNQISVHHTKESKLYDQMAIRLAHQFFEESRITRNFNDVERETRVEKVDAYSINWDFDKRLGNHRLFYGLELVHDDVDSKGRRTNLATGANEPGPSRYPQADWDSYAAYITNQYQLTERSTLHAGVRLNVNFIRAEFDTTFYPFPFQESKLNNEAVTGNLGWVMRPSEKLVLSLNTSTGFRMPNVDDIGKVFDSEPGNVVVPNPNLQAEYAFNTEFAVTKVFSDCIKLDAASYYTALENALVRRNFSLNGLDSIVYDGLLSRVQAVQNAAFTRILGIQAGIEVKLPRGITFSSRINIQKGEEELDDGTVSPSRHAPPWFGNSRLTYQFSKYNAIQVYLLYSGEFKFEDLPEGEKSKQEIYAVDENGNPWSPGWYTLNIKANYQIKNSFTLNAGVENITNRRYRTYSSGIAAAGRNFLLSLNCQF